MSSSLHLDKWKASHSKNILSQVPNQLYPLLKSPSPSPHEIFSMDFLREDWTSYPTYIIDPSGCQDADDGFSLWEDLSGIHLMVHIADPTAWFTPNASKDAVFQCILRNGTTFYLSEMEPKHMFGKTILDASKLNADVPRRVISVHSILHPKTYSVISSNVEFGWIQTTPAQRITYQEASEQIVSNPVISLGVDIANVFRRQRTATSPESQALAELSLAFPYVSPANGKVILSVDPPDVRAVKSMISEFAIHSNQVFAKEIEGGDAGETFRRAILTATSSVETFNPSSITPSSTPPSTLPPKPPPTPQEVIANIISAGKSAAYTTEKLPHELVNTEAYTHATSPLRRAPDCIVHFLIKCARISLPRPFTDFQLRTWCNDLTKQQKIAKNLGFADTKFRYFQYIAQQLELVSPIPIPTSTSTPTPLPVIKYKIISYRNGFVNIHIHNINDFQVHITYSLRRKYTQFPEYLLPMETPRTLPITRINIPSKFDEGTLPDLDLIFPPV